MMISTRGRYALRVMLDLAERCAEGYLPMKDIASRQNISLKYLERILPVLVKNGLLEGSKGQSGGYRLTRAPADYSVGEILRLTEGDLAPVACLECNAPACPRAETCRTLPMWAEFHRLANNYFDGVTLEELLKNGV